MTLCSLTTSRALHDLGYDGGYNSYYLPDGKLEDIEYKVMTGQPIYEGDDFIPCPRLDDAAYFLREQYGLMALVEPVAFGLNGQYRATVMDIWQHTVPILDGGHHDDHDAALEAAVNQIIDLIKSDSEKYAPRTAVNRRKSVFKSSTSAKTATRKRKMHVDY